ncbi:MAG TPA: glycosyltransferase family 4 protein [Polyangiaceae bacterium]|nr:glycosyltransferase family 4 protein [Polyangiaceae bacterium]
MRVLFISKPIAPPFQDGSKCLVRDIATHLHHVDPVVLSVPGAPELQRVAADAARPKTVEMVPVYSSGGSYAPAFAQNLRAAAWILLRAQADVFHFVFAPNARTSKVGRFLSRRKGVPVVQTIASPPRSFAGVEELLFGEVVVAQSRWTEQQVRTEYERSGSKCPEIAVIPPPVPTDLSRTNEQQAEIRRRLEVPEGAPLFVYPGDLEVSSGADTVAQIAQRLTSEMPSAVVVFAYRRKTPRADEVAQQLRARLGGNVRFAGSLPDVLSLVAASTAVVFPVDDLWGKVDLPIVLLEAMVLGVPVIALGQGPLLDLAGAELLGSLESEEWVRAMARVEGDPAVRRRRVEEQRAALVRYGAGEVAGRYEEIYLRVGARGA